MNFDLETLKSQTLQLSTDNKLKHFLQIEGLSKEFLLKLIDKANYYLENSNNFTKNFDVLTGKSAINLFFENSTRTRISFELAQHHLGAKVINFDADTSSTKKGETLLDTIKTLEAMKFNFFVVRHSAEGAAHFIAANVGPEVAVINAGDGCHAHPTQAMLDALTIYRHKGDFSKLKIAIVGDIKHSRVARSQIAALQTLGVKQLRAVGPEALLPEYLQKKGVATFTDLQQGLEDVDVVMLLRIQKERMNAANIPSFSEYHQTFGINAETLTYAKKDAVVMHPGPINREVEIASEIADGNRSLILQQVTYGVAMRMAILATLQQ